MSNTGSMVMYGVGITDPPPWEPVAPPWDEETTKRAREWLLRPTADAALADATKQRETAEAVVRWYADVHLLRRPADRVAHSKPCKLWEALRAMEWARCSKMTSVGDGALVTMWLYGKRERR